MKEKKWFFNVIEEFIQNEKFLKKYPDYRGGRIEIWHRDYPYDVEEVRFMLPTEIFVKLQEAIDFKECDLFQLGDIRSEDLEKKVKRLIDKQSKK